MPAAYEEKADDFVATMNFVLRELAGGTDHRAECVIEAANLVSAVIDADGQVTASLPLNEAGFVDAALQACRKLT